MLNGICVRRPKLRTSLKVFRLLLTFLDYFDAKYLTPESAQHSSTPSINQSKQSAVFRHLKRKKVESPITNELDNYLSRELEDYSTSPITWWKTKTALYPNLSLMARDFLAIPGTSTPSERVFSGGRQLLPYTRNRMGGKTVQAISCLKSWLKNKEADDVFEEVDEGLLKLYSTIVV